MNRLAYGLVPLIGVISLCVVLSRAQPNRPVTEQIYCTGTATPGSLFAYVSQAPGSGSAPVAIQPFRCLTLDPAVFMLNAAGQLTIKAPAPIATIGIPCTAPPSGSTDGAIIYAQVPDGSCLALVAIPAPDVLQGFSGAYQTLYVKIPGTGTVSPIGAKIPAQ